MNLFYLASFVYDIEQLKKHYLVNIEHILPVIL